MSKIDYTTPKQIALIRTILADRNLLTSAGKLAEGYGHRITMPAGLNQYTDEVGSAFCRVIASDAACWIAAHLGK